MKLTPEIIKKIEEAFEHTKLNGDVNWQDGDEIDVCLAGTFAADKFISIINRTRSSTTKKKFYCEKIKLCYNRSKIFLL